MSKYRKVDVKIWNDAKFVSLSERGKLVFLFLMTHPNLTMVGAMRATAPGLAAEIGITLEGFREAFLEALSKGMAKVDKSAALIWLPNFLKYNKPESPNVVKAWPDAFDMLPECELKSEVFQHVRGFVEGMTEGFRKAFREAFGKGLPDDFAKTSQNQEQEQEQEQEPEEKTLVPVGTPPRPEEFASIWNSLRGPLPQVREFTDSRRRKIKVRMTQGLTLTKFEEVIRRCLSTPFLVGENDRGWQADFDWLIENDTNMAKVLEGKYTHGGPTPVQPRRDVPSLESYRDPVREAEQRMIEEAEAFDAAHRDEPGFAAWKDILSELAKTVLKQSFDTWLKPTRYSHSIGNTMFVRIPGVEFEHLSTKYHDEIMTASEALGLEFTDIRFITPMETMQIPEEAQVA